MACSITIDSAVGRAVPSRLTVSGTVNGTCSELQLRIFQLDNAGGTASANPFAAVTVAVAADGSWTSEIDVAAEVHCKYPFRVIAQCSSGDRCRAERDFEIDCVHCPDVELIDFRVATACEANPFGDLVRDATVRVRASWTDPVEPPVMAEVTLYLPQVANSAIPDPASEIDDQVVQFTTSGATEAADFTLRAGFSYSGRLAVYFPNECAETVPFTLSVPGCDCPPGPSGALSVTDPGGNPLTDTEACVDADSITVCAPAYGASTALSFATDPEVAFTPVAGQPRCISVPLPASGARVHVYARFGTGQCLYEKITSAKRCVAAPPPDTGRPSVEEEPATPDICTIFSVLFLLGLGLLVLGAAIALCPAFGEPVINTPTMFLIGLGLLAAGAVIALIFGLLWLFLCKPSICEWIAVLWKFAFLATVVFLYLGFCPACAAVGWGVGGAMLLVTAGLLFWWFSQCKPTACDVFNELVVLLPAFDVVGILEIVLGQCIITSNPIAAGVYAGVLALYTIVVIAGQQMTCDINQRG